MSKPWTNDPHGRQLEAFVGAYQIKTSQFSITEELVWFACQLFEIDPETHKTVEQAATAIAALSKKERSARAHRNRPKLFPDLPKPSERTVSEYGLQRMMDASVPKMIDGEPFDCDGELDIDPASLLRKVVSAVISAGHADDLYEFPEVLAFFGARIPNRDELTGHHAINETMLRKSEKWPNRKH